jgi:hypothetical protein
MYVSSSLVCVMVTDSFYLCLDCKLLEPRSAPTLNLTQQTEEEEDEQ